MKNGLKYLLLSLIVCPLALSCSRTATKTPERGTLESAVHECRQAQQDHYLNAGLKPKEEHDKENEVVPYRVYEGVPSFSLQDCMNERWSSGR